MGILFSICIWGNAGYSSQNSNRADNLQSGLPQFYPQRKGTFICYGPSACPSICPVLLACASIDYIFFLLDIMSVFLPYSFRNGYIKKVIPVSFWCSFKREIKLFNPSSFKAVTFQVCPIWHFLMDFFLLMGRPLLRCLAISVIFFIYIWLYSAMNMQKGLYLYEQFYT